MVRTARELRNGGYYHIVTRGNDRKRLFRTKGDYRFFLDTIAKYQGKYDVGMMHYCLMPNHVHFLIQAYTCRDLPKFMQSVLQTYGFYFRRRYHSVGFMFQNRYVSKMIKDEIHLLECGRYIERNPLRAHMVDDLEKFNWSSYAYYALGKEDPLIKSCNQIYLYLSNQSVKRMEFYKDLFAEDRPYETIVDKEFKLA